MAQSVARHIGNVEVTGSIPVSSFPKPTYLRGLFLFRVVYVHFPVFRTRFSDNNFCIF